MANQGYFSNLEFGGWATDADNDHYVDSADLTFTGELGFVINGLNARVTFDFQHGGFQPGQGILFTAGSMQLDVLTADYGWTPYSIIDVATTNMPFLAGQPGHMTNYDPNGQTTAGVVHNALPGLWDGQIGGTGYDRAASVMQVLGVPIGIYLEGSITPNDDTEPRMQFGPPEVPVPAAAWLFGSGLAGLAGARGLRRRQA